ncbi:MAG: GDSL-type esterase/lipase family protein, partial [Nanoarchaeota archaeon]
RLTLPVDQHRDTEFSFYAYDELLGWTNKAGSSGMFRIPASTTTITISGQGLRDIDHVLPKPSGTQRVVVLGDSQTWGYGVAQTSRFTEIMRDSLRIDVVNMGVTGYGTGQEYLLLRRYGMRFAPDIVVVAFYANDLGDNTNDNNDDEFSYPRPVLRVCDGHLRVDNVPVPLKSQWKDHPNYFAVYGPVKGWLLQHSRLFYLGARQLSVMVDTFAKRMGWREEVPAHISDSSSQAWQTTFFILDHMHAWLVERDVQLVVAVIPSRDMVRRDVTVYEDQLTAWGTRSGVPVVTFNDLFQGKVDDLFLRYDSHMNEQGHMVVGERLSDVLTPLLIE